MDIRNFRKRVISIKVMKTEMNFIFRTRRFVNLGLWKFETFITQKFDILRINKLGNSEIRKLEIRKFGISKFIKSENLSLLTPLCHSCNRIFIFIFAIGFLNKSKIDIIHQIINLSTCNVMLEKWYVLWNKHKEHVHEILYVLGVTSDTFFSSPHSHVQVYFLEKVQKVIWYFKTIP